MKRKIQLVIMVVLMTTNFVFAQAPNIKWAKCYGGSDGEVGRCIQPTKDGGYIVVGNSGSKDGDVGKNAGDEDCWVLKLNNVGDTLWSKVLGGTKLDFAMSVEQTPDNGYLVAMQSSSNNGDFSSNSGRYDLWMLKLDEDGTIIWKKRFGGSGDDVPRDILITNDNNYLIAGSSSSQNGGVWGNHGSSDFWLLKLNQQGDTLWSRTYGGTGSDQAFSIQKTNDNGYLMVGQTDSKNGDVHGNHGGIDYWVIKLNFNGDTIWTKAFGGKDNDCGQTILQTKDGGIIVGGSSQSNNGDVSGHHGDSTKADIWIVKLNNSGVIQWQKSIGGTNNEALYGSLLAFSMIENAEGGYTVASFTASNDGDVTSINGLNEAWLFKLNNVGVLQWQKSFGGPGSDMAYSIRQNNDGSLVLSGMAGSNGGDVTGNHIGADFWVIKFFAPAKNDVLLPINDVALYPNPASNFITMSNAPIGSHVKIMNSTGQIVYYTQIQTNQQTINISDYKSGVYVIEVENTGTRSFNKFIKLNN